MIKNWNKVFLEQSTRRYTDSLGMGDASANHLVDEFEDRCSQYYGRICVFMSSGTAALFFALWHARERGFLRVAVPDRSWIANLNVPLLLGFDVEFVDISACSPVADWSTSDPSLYASQVVITQLIHISGFICDRPQEATFCVEDFSQANVRTQNCEMIGALGEVSICSLGITKAFSTIHGGLFLCDDVRTAQQARHFARNGVRDNLVESWGQMGLNFKPNPLGASVGLFELDRLDTIIDRIHEVEGLYESYLGRIGLDLFKGASALRSLPLYNEIQYQGASDLCKYLVQKGVQAKLAPPPLSSASYCSSPHEQRLHTDTFSKRIVSLPSGPDMSARAVQRVVEEIERFFDHA